MRLAPFVSVLSVLFLSACAVFGIRREEEPAFTATRLAENVELREYAGYAVAEVLVDGSRNDAANEAFRILFAYISGENVPPAPGKGGQTSQGGRKIPMTAPVTQAREPGAKIPMTAPVTQQSETTGGPWVVQFVLPSSMTAATAPQPTNPRVLVRDVPGRKALVLTYSGRATDAAIAERTAELRAVAAKNAVAIHGDPLLAYYDPPFTIPWFRRNEVQFAVK